MKNKALRKTFFKMIILIVVLAIVSYAWFITSKESNLYGYNVSTQTFNNIEISIDEGNTWDMIANLSIPTEFLFRNEITGNGIDLYKAANKNEDGDPIGFTSATLNEDYLEFNLMFRSAKDATLFLEQSSYVIPSAGINYENLIGSSVLRISSGGDYSRDLIAGAVRVAFIDNELVEGVYVPSSDASLVWAPNPNIEMVYSGGVYLPLLNSTNQQNYQYYYFDGNQYSLTNVENIKDIISANSSGLSGGDPLISFLPANEVKQITVRIWIEGTDREAITELKGGQFLINFGFTGISKLNDLIAPLVSVSGSNISGYDSTMEYSSNFGLTWIDYSLDNNPSFTAGTEVWVRKSETSEYFPSTYTELLF